MVRTGFEPATYGFQIRRSNHSATLPSCTLWSLAFYRVESCAVVVLKRIFNAVIRSGLERNMEVPIRSNTQDTQVRIKRRLPSSVSSQDRSLQAQALKKSLNFSESTPSNATNKENMTFDVNQETITPRVSRFTAELNVKILCGKQTSQVEELTVNLNGRIDSSHRQFFISRALTIPTATVIFTFISKAKRPLGNI